MRQQQQRLDDDHEVAQAPEAEAEDREGAVERSSHLAEKQVAQLRLADDDLGVEDDASPDFEGLDNAVTAAAGGEAEEKAAEEKPEKPAAGAAPAALPEEARKPLEQATGADLSGVKMVTDSPLAEEMGAVAVTTGEEVHVAPGAPKPETAAGQRLMSHELTHVVQQREGRVDGADGAVNDDAALENEADAAEKAPSQAAPSASSAAPVQRKTKIKKVKAEYFTAAQLRAKKLGDFLGYVQGQLDWAVKIAPADKKPLQDVLTWASRSPFLGGGCAQIPVDELIASGNHAAIEAYAKGVNMPAKAPTAKLKSVTSAVEAEAMGAAVLRLLTVLDGKNLYHISNEDWMEALVKGGHTETLVKYVTTCKPALHAPDGRELESFIQCVQEVGDPSKFKSTLPKIRNYHRFEGTALTMLNGNFADVSRARPLGLILHTALDWNGAFHRDPNLTALIQHPRNLMLMVEGFDSLGAYQGEIGPLAKAYGRGGKIDQVMIAGHGSARSMELAGEVAPGMEGDTPTMNYAKNDGLDLDGKSKETTAFFDEIINNMEEAPSWPFMDDDGARRVVFNACLTGANDIDIKDTAAGGAPYDDQIKDSLKNKPSLSTAFGQQAAGKDITSLGANGSFGQIELMETIFRMPYLAKEMDENGVEQLVTRTFPIGNGMMSLGSEVDPSLTAPKLEYVEKGDDPPGVMMALLQSWSAPTGTTPWEKAVDKHVTNATDGWHDTQIKTLFELVQKKYKASPPGIKGLVTVADALEYLDNAPGLTWIAEKVAANPDGYAIIQGLRRVKDWNYYHKVILEHASAQLGHGADLIAELDSGWTADRLLQVLDPKWLEGKGKLAPLLAPTDSPTPGQIILAAVDAFRTGGSVATKAFFRKLMKGGSLFPDSYKIGSFLGTKTEDDLLDALGFKGAPKGGGGDTVELANVNLDNSVRNETYLEPVNLPGTVTASELNVRKKASRGADVIGSLKSGDTVFVVGKTGDWLGIDFGKRTAFVHKDHVTVA